MKTEDGGAQPQKETEVCRMPDAVKMHNIDVAEFTEIINSCVGDVYMVTPDGDRLNLKSKAVSPGEIELNFEVRLREADTGFVNELGAMSGVDHVVLVSYNGDYMG